jgi:hypothetical protein
MHRALRLVDVIEHIVRQFGDRQEDYDQTSLHALALTNRAFSEFALDLLWREATPLMLRHAMPDHTWKVGSGTWNRTSAMCYVILDHEFPLDIYMDSSIKKSSATEVSLP